MSEQGLKAIKQAPQLADLKVTPELKARLQERIERAKREPETTRPRPVWVRPVFVTAAAACILALALNMNPAPGREAKPGEQAEGAVPAPAPSSQAARGSSPIQITNLTAMVQDAKGAKIDAYDQDGAPPATAGLTGAEAQPGRKIITNGEYSLRVLDARAAASRLQQEAIAAGGYVAEAAVNKESSGAWSGRVVLRVPAEKVGAAIAALGQVGTVERERLWTQDVTDQYMDVEHRSAILKEHEERLRELASKAATFDDWNRLTGQLNSTRVEIENLTGRLKLLGNQVDYAVLNVGLYQPAPLEAPKVEGATTLGGQVGQAFVNSVGALLSLGRRAAIGLAALAPYALVGLPLAAVGFVAVRRRRKAAKQ